MPDVTVRLARPDDLEALVRLMAAVQVLHADALPDVFRAELDEAAARTMLANALREDRVFVAERMRSAAGYAWLAFVERAADAAMRERRFAYINHIGVVPDLRGRGSAAPWSRRRGKRRRRGASWRSASTGGTSTRPRVHSLLGWASSRGGTWPSPGCEGLAFGAPAASAGQNGAREESPMFMATLNFALGEDIEALRDLVRGWAQERVAPMAAEIDRENLFPAELWREMGELGLLGITVPEEYGGAGMGYLAHVVAVEEIARASASVSLSYGAHSNLCVNQIKLNGTEAQKREVPAEAGVGRACRARSRCRRRGRGRTWCRCGSGRKSAMIAMC